MEYFAPVSTNELKYVQWYEYVLPSVVSKLQQTSCHLIKFKIKGYIL